MQLAGTHAGIMPGYLAGMLTCQAFASTKTGASGSRLIALAAPCLLQLFQANTLDLAFLCGQALDLDDCSVSSAFLADIGQDNDVGFAFALFRLALQHGIDGNALVGQDTRDVSQHAWLVLDAQTQVVTGLDLAP